MDDLRKISLHPENLCSIKFRRARDRSFLSAQDRTKKETYWRSSFFRENRNPAIAMNIKKLHHMILFLFTFTKVISLFILLIYYIWNYLQGAHCLIHVSLVSWIIDKFAPKWSYINHMDRFGTFLTPPFYLRGPFYWIRLMSPYVVIWTFGKSIHPPAISTWFMNDP